MLEDETIKNFLKKYWAPALTSLMLIACVFIWVDRSYSSHQIQASTDFADVERLFSSYKIGQPLSIEQTQQAHVLLKRHPELLPTYDISLAEAFLIQQDTAMGSKLAQAHFNKTYKNLPLHYQEYCKASFDILEEKWDDAYLRTLKVEQLVSEKEECKVLRGLNYMRLCALAERLEKKAPWETFKALPCFEEIATTCSEGNLTLESFIASKSL